MPAGTLGPPRTGSFLIGGVVVLPVWPSAATQHGQGSGNMGVFEGPEPSAAFLRVDAARISPIGPNTDLGFQASLFIDDSHTEDYAVLSPPRPISSSAPFAIFLHSTFARVYFSRMWE